MYTVLVRNDNSIVASQVERIMHRSSNVNTLCVLVDTDYTNKNDEVYDMRDFSCVFEFRTPISNKYIPIIVEPELTLYKDRIQYLLPFNTELTAEPGDLQLKFIFTKLEMQADGTKREISRPTPTINISILPVSQWSDYIADSNLDAIAQVMLTLQSKIEQEKAYAEMLNVTKADAIRIDKENQSLSLDADGKTISSVDLKELSDELTESSDTGTVKVII